MRLLICLVAMLILCQPAFGDGVPCKYRQLLSTYQSNGTIYAEAVLGETVVLATSRGIEFVDVQDIGSPRRVGLWNATESMRDFTIQNGVLYAVSNGFLYILDISDVTHPVQLSTLSLTTGNAPSVAVSGSLVYISGISGISVVDASDLAAPVQVAALPLPFSYNLGIAYRFSIDGHLLYTAWSNFGVLVLDISDPMNISILNIIQLPDGANDLVLRENLLYVAGYESGLYIFDVADPADLVEVGRMETSGGVRGLSFDGDTMFAAEADAGAARYDISIPTSPRRLGAIDLGVTDAIIAVGQNAIAIHGSAMYIVSLNENPADPLIAEVRILDSNGIEDIAIRDSIVYILTSNALEIYDVSDPQNPHIRSRVVRFGQKGIALEGAFAYLSGDGGSVTTLYVANPDAPVIVSSVPGIDNDGGSIAVADEMAYVAGSRVEIFQLSFFAEPALVGSFDIPSQADNIEVVGGIAYVACRSLGLIIYDVSDPTRPAMLGQYDTPSIASHVVARDGIAFVSDTQTVQIIGVSDPRNPSLISVAPAPGFKRGLFVDDDVLYVASDYFGVSAIDVTDKVTPQLLGYYDSPSSNRGVVVCARDRVVYFGEKGSGLKVIDFSDCPPCTADFDGDGSATQLDVQIFLDTFVNQDDHADLDGNGSFNFFDVVLFFQRYNAGCK